LDTGRTDTGRADAGHPPDAGHWTGGRWTRGRWRRTLTGRQRYGGHPDVLGTTTPLGRRTVLLWAAHAALGTHDGSAVRPPASARACRLHYKTAARSLRRRQAAPRRTALLGRL